MPTRRQMEAMLIVSVATISAYHFARLWGQKRLATNPEGPLGMAAKAVVFS